MEHDAYVRIRFEISEEDSVNNRPQEVAVFYKADSDHFTMSTDEYSFETIEDVVSLLEAAGVPASAEDNEDTPEDEFDEYRRPTNWIE